MLMNNNSLYLFGGCRVIDYYCLNSQFVSDAWMYRPSSLTNCSAGGTWTVISNYTPYSMFAGATVLYPNTSQATIACVPSFSETVSYLPLTGSQAHVWQAVTPNRLSATFPLRIGPSAVWINSSQSVFVYGGYELFMTAPVVWHWFPAASTWLQNDNTPLLQGLVGAALAVTGNVQSANSDWTNSTIFLFGGMTSNQVPSNQVYRIFANRNGLLFAPVTIKTSSSLSPAPRIYSSFDGSSYWEYKLLFGGWGSWGSQLYNDLWAFYPSDGNINCYWQFINTSAQLSPSPRCMHASASGYDAYNGPCLVIYGGLMDGIPFWAAELLGLTLGTSSNETWIFCTSNFQWRQLKTSPSPPPLAAATMVFSSVLDGYVLYGGFSHAEGIASDQVWFLNTHYTWSYYPRSPLSSSSISPARGMHAMSLDFGTSQFVISGGLGSGRLPLNDTWTFVINSDKTVTFTPLNTNFAPYLNSHSLLFYRPPQSELLFLLTFGGFSTNSDNSEPTWASPVNALYPVCNQGSIGTFGNCTLCPIGTQSPMLGSSTCFPCPDGTTTALDGAVSVQDCNKCTPGWCSNHGSCSVRLSSDGVPSALCSCDAAWTGSRCTTPYVLILMMSLVGVAIAIAIGLILRWRGKQVEQLAAQSEITQRLLQNHEQELNEFRQASMVDIKDLCILEKVDQGAFGDVFRATYRELPVALKTLRANLLEMDDSLAMEMEHEIEFMRTLRHTNILFFFGAGKFEDGKAFIVVEWAARGSLLKILRNDSIELSDARRLALVDQTAAGMSFLHARQCIHRDLKIYKK